MKYFRNYPWGMQLLLFLLMTFTFMSSIGAIILSLFTKLSGYAPSALQGINESSPFSLVKAVLYVQGLQNLFVFCLPSLAFAYLCHPDAPSYLGLRKPGKPIQMLLSVLLIIGAMPVLIMLENLIGKIDFGASVKTAQAAQEQMMGAMLHTPAFVDYLRVLLIMAVVPALGEELFFRGMLMRFARKRSKNMLFPILFSAVVFSFTHANVYGYLPIFMAGALLAGIYYLTGSLWCSILAHFFFNGTQVTLRYISNGNAALKSALEDSNSIPLVYVLAGAALFAGAAWYLWQQRAPLPNGWTDDFTQAEMEQLKNEKRRGLF